MRSPLFRLLAALFLYGMSACQSELSAQTGYYVPKALAVPAHSKANQLKILLGYGAGIEGLVSYAAQKPFLVFCQGTFRFWNTKGTDILLSAPFTVVRGEQIFRAGGGYIVRSEQRYFNVLEVLGAGGYFLTDSYRYFNNAPDKLSRTTTKCRSVFAQFNASHAKDDLDFSIAFRVSHLSYSRFLYQYESDGFTVKNLHALTLDPVAAFGTTSENFKFDIQLGFSIPLKTWKGYEVSNAGLIRDRDIEFLYTFLGRVAVQYQLNFTRKPR